MKKHGFTLVELLVVVGIIAILAGLLTPAVIGAQQQGRITQAKSDMATILMALKGLDGTYGKMLYKDGGKFYIGKKDSNDAWSVDSNKSAKLVGPEQKDAYYAFIAELSDPSNAHITTLVNRRKIKFLDPKPEYNPGVAYDNANNLPHLWIDPWGNPYVILVNIDYTDEIVDPSNTSNRLAAKAVAYSYGPDGASSNADEQKDNVCSWKDSWM